MQGWCLSVFLFEIEITCTFVVMISDSRVSMVHFELSEVAVSHTGNPCFYHCFYDTLESILLNFQLT